MSRRSTTSAIAVLTVLTIALSARANYRDGSKAIQVSGGEDHTIVLTANKWAWSCGPNGYRVGELIYYFGVLGTGSSDPDLKQKVLVRIHGPGDVGYLEDICAIDAGWQHSLALDVNDSVWSWGWNSEGQLGIDSTEYKTAPVQVWRGDQPDDPCDPSIYLKHITAISAGRSGQHSLALDANGYAYGWGYNEYGQCGNDANNCDELTPVYVRQGEQPDDPNDANDWLKHVVDISAGSNNSIALEADNADDPNLNGCVYTWGCNMWGEEFTDTMITDGWGLLGNGSGSAVTFSDTPVKVLRGEQDYNEPGQIYLENIVAVSAGWDHLMALENYVEYDSYLDLTDPYYVWPDPNYRGRVYTWGNNGDGWDSGGGRLGNGSATDGNSTPVLVLRGEQPPDEPNDTYPYLCHIVAVSAGEGHSMALDVNGYVYCWGDNKYGQLGNGCIDPCTTPVRVVGPNDVGYLENIIAISAGYWHSLAIDVNGTVWAWGKTKDGRLGLADMAYATSYICSIPHRIPVVYNQTQETYAFAIQPAVDDANEEDILEASPGIYYENVIFARESITLQSEDPQDAAIVADTIVDARYNAGAGVYTYYPAVDFNDSSGSTLAGLTLVNGTGGGVVCENVDFVTITNCLIHDNEWHGISLTASSAGIQNCEIRANTSDETYDSHGVYCISDSNLNVANSVIADNAGDGIYCNQSTAAITNCLIEDSSNRGVYCGYSDSNITNCIIRNNGDDGINCLGCDVIAHNCIIEQNSRHGLYNENSSSASITNSIISRNNDHGIYSSTVTEIEIKNNWIYGNGADESGDGIHVYMAYPVDAVIRNNTVVDNSDYGIHADYATEISVSNCIIWGNGDDNLHKDYQEFDNIVYSCIEGGWPGNIDSDPRFVDANANDFHLAADSLCIDAGDPDFEPEPNETDIDGGPRVMDGDANDTVIVDMGADEFWPADFSRDGFVNFIDYALLTLYWRDAGVDYNDVFLYGDSNSVGLKQFCEDWLRGGGSPPGPMPLMAGRSGGEMTEALSLQVAPYELTAVEKKSLIAEPVDVEKLLDWLAEIWLDPEVREGIDAEAWLKLYESVKDLE